MATPFLRQVTQAGISLPPFDPFTTRVYDVPYPNSRSIQFAKWHFNELTMPQKEKIAELFKEIGKDHPKYKSFGDLEDDLWESFTACCRDNIRALMGNEGQLNPTHLSRTGNYGLRRRCYIWINQAKESWETLDEEAKKQVRTLTFIGGSVLTIFALFMAKGAIWTPIQPKL